MCAVRFGRNPLQAGIPDQPQKRIRMRPRHLRRLDMVSATFLHGFEDGLLLLLLGVARTFGKRLESPPAGSRAISGRPRITSASSIACSSSCTVLSATIGVRTPISELPHKRGFVQDLEDSSPSLDNPSAPTAEPKRGTSVETERKAWRSTAIGSRSTMRQITSLENRQLS